MATFNKFNQFPEDLGLGVHNFSTHTLRVYLSNTAPDAGLDAVKADLAEIATGSGYTGPVDIQNTWSETSGTATLGGTDVTITASSGTVGPFQYVPLYNDDPTSPADPLIGWWAHTAAVTLQDGESFLIDFGASILDVS